MIKEIPLQPADFNFEKTPYEKSNRLLKSERNRQAYEEAKEDLFSLIKPVVGWNIFQIEKLGSSITLHKFLLDLSKHS